MADDIIQNMTEEDWKDYTCRSCRYGSCYFTARKTVEFICYLDMNNIIKMQHPKENCKKYRYNPKTKKIYTFIWNMVKTCNL